MVKYLLISILLFQFFLTYSQPSEDVNLDSLKTLLQVEQNTTNKIKILLQIGEAIEETEPNSALHYYNKAFLMLQNETDSNLFADTYLRMANAYELKGNIDTSMTYFKKALRLYSQSKDYKNIGSCYNGIGNLFYYRFDLSNAILYYQKSMEIFKKIPNSDLSIANELHNIGLVHHDNGNYSKALKYYRKSLKVFKKNHVIYWISNCYNSIASVFMDVNQTDSAIFYYKEAINFANKDRDIFNMEMIYANLGQVYLKKKDFQKSLAYYVQAESLAKKINDEIGYADIYQGMGNLFYKMKEYHKSLKYTHKAIVYAKKTQSREYLEQCYFLLKEDYKNIQDYQNALVYADLLNNIKDSLYTVNKAKAIAKTEALYQNKQKQLTINNLEKENALNKEKAKKQYILLISVIIGLFVISGFLIFIIRLFRKNQRTNRFLASKNIEILAQRDEIEVQRDLVMAQKNKIENINKDIAKSIDYAKRIQISILPEQTILFEFISDAFVFFKPRDIVSGDFYWWTHMKLDNELVIAVADCTGHGVPGAFMSMLGISFLREIVTKEYVSHPGVILRKIRKEVVNALKQKSELGGQKDGMDMAIISINHETNVVQYSGANNPLYIITNYELRIMNKESNNYVKLYDNLELSAANSPLTKGVRGIDISDNINSKSFYEIKPDKMPIAIYEKMDKFTNHKIQLEKGDQIYLFSDGFADQFGGPKGKKFKYKPFKQLLIDNCELPMAEQKTILEKTFDDWKGNLEQVDDITVVGIRI